MADVHTPEQRSFNMSRIKSRDTKPEILLRKALWAKGFRYRIKNKLPGKPDIIFPKQKIAIFVDGCFWHGCPRHFQMPATRKEFWEKKITENQKRDQKVTKALRADGWKVLRFWEHEVTDLNEKILVTIFCLFSKSKFPAGKDN